VAARFSIIRRQIPMFAYDDRNLLTKNRGTPLPNVTEKQCLNCLGRVGGLNYPTVSEPPLTHCQITGVSYILY